MEEFEPVVSFGWLQLVGMLLLMNFWKLGIELISIAVLSALASLEELVLLEYVRTSGKRWIMKRIWQFGH